MTKARIVERTHQDGRKEYVIQQKHFLFRWMWVDAWENSLLGAWCRDSFPTFEEAEQNMCFFDGSQIIDKVYVRGDGEE